MEGDVSAVGALIERGAALEAKDDDGNTPLILANDVSRELIRGPCTVAVRLAVSFRFVPRTF